MSSDRAGGRLTHLLQVFSKRNLIFTETCKMIDENYEKYEDDFDRINCLAFYKDFDLFVYKNGVWKRVHTSLFLTAKSLLCSSFVVQN